MKKYSLLGFLLLLASSSFAQGRMIKGVKQAAKAVPAAKVTVPAVKVTVPAVKVTVPAAQVGAPVGGVAKTFIGLDRTSLGVAVRVAPNVKGWLPKIYRSQLTLEVERYRTEVSRTQPVENMSALEREKLSRLVVEAAQESTLSWIPTEDIESYGASLLLEKKVKGLNDGGFSFPEQVLRRPADIPFNSADEVDFVLNGETLRLDRNSGAEALQMARVLDLSIKEFGPEIGEMTLEEYAVFNVLNQRFQKAYKAFKMEGVWQLDETVPVSKFNYSLSFKSPEGLKPVLKEAVPNNLVLKEAELTTALAGSMADLILFMARGGGSWTFDDVLQSFSNTMGFAKNSLRDFIFINSPNKI